MRYLRVVLSLVAVMWTVVVAASEADVLFGKADAAEKSSDYDAVLTLYLQANVAFVAEGRGESAEIAQSYHNTGRVYNNLKNIAEGRRYTKMALDLRKKLFGEVNEDYITSLNNYALTFFMEDDYATAITHQTQVMNLCDRLASKHPNYGMYAVNLGRFYYMANDYANAAKYWELALPEVEKFGELYEFILEYLGTVYIEMNDSQNIARIMALSQEHNEHEFTKPCEDLQCMLERAEIYGYTGDNTAAKEWYLKALALPGDAASKAMAHEAYAKYLRGIKDWIAAADYYASAATLRKQSEGESERYANVMYLSATCYFIGDEFKKAIEYFGKVVDFYSRFDSQSAQENIAKCNKSIGNAYSGLKDHATAIGYFAKVVDYYAVTDTSNEEYPKALLRLAKAEKFNNQYALSIEHHKQAMAMFESRGMYEDYEDAATSLQMCYYYSGQDEVVESETDAVRKARHEKLDGIIKQELEMLDLTQAYFGQLAYAGSLGTIAGCYTLKEEYRAGVDYYKQYMETVRKAIAEEFRMQSEDERMITWSQESANMKEIYDLLMLLPAGNETLLPDLAALSYDAALLSKGILLKSSIEFEKILQQYGDYTLKSKYDLIKSNDAEIARLRQTAATEADMDKILNLTRQNQALQMELYRGCAEFADFTDYISYDWQDVRDAMQPTDVAIEFAAIRTGVLDNENYIVALALTKDMTTPVALPVCSFLTANAMSNDSTLYASDIPGQVVWGMLSGYLQGKKRVFFSADGAFNRIGIEYLRYNGRSLSEQFEVYRLSTTKELCYKHTDRQVTHVALFGDIDYTFSESTQSATDNVAKMRSGQFANLENTLKEITEIDAILKDKGVVTAVLKGEEAGEDVFKSLSNSKVNIIHIASHGVYREDKKSTDEDAMTNSILAFSGANLADDTTDADSDGIVTAADVAKMNLRRCDLAVLSACESGLGKLGDDGVYGLQRGFKNAGVQSLLMSIKNVYDESTAILMERFYRYLMNGCDKRQALVNAQRDLRENGYADGRYWATFILLDAFTSTR